MPDPSKIKVLPMTPKRSAETPPKVLTPVEVWGLEKSHLLADLRKAELSIISLRKASLADKRTIFNLSAKDTETAILKEENAVLKNQVADSTAHTNLVESIKTRLNLKTAAFGVDPDTLEVVE